MDPTTVWPGTPWIEDTDAGLLVTSVGVFPTTASAPPDPPAAATESWGTVPIV